MKYVKSQNKARNSILIKQNEYQVILKIILKHADTVCFTVYPYLDAIEELREDIRYQQLMSSYIDSEYTKSIHTENCKESLVYFKLDHYMIEFLKDKKHIFDFCDEEAAINLEDIVFIGKGNIVCDTITHENYCGVTDELLYEVEKKLVIS